MRKRLDYIYHRDEALRIVGMMPARREDETDEAFERRVSKAASDAEREHGLRPLQVGKSSARGYHERELLAVRERIVKPL